MFDDKVNALVLKVGNTPSDMFEDLQMKLDRFQAVSGLMAKVIDVGGLLDVVDTLRDLKDEYYITSQAYTKWKELNPEFVSRCENGGDDVTAMELLNWQKLESDYAVCSIGLGAVNRVLRKISKYNFHF